MRGFNDVHSIKAAYKVVSAALRAAHVNAILLALRGQVHVVVAAEARGEGQVVVVAVLKFESGLDAVVEAGVPGDLVRRNLGELEGVLQRHLEDSLPVRAKVEGRGAVDADPVGVDGVVGGVVASVEANGAVVRPGAHLHGVGAGHANHRVFLAQHGHGVVHVVLLGIFLIVHIRGLAVVSVTMYISMG